MTAPSEIDPEPRLAELSRRPPVAALGEVASRHDFPVYLVGGVLRDVLIGIDSDDIDVAVAGGFEAFLTAAARRFDRRLHDLGDVWQQTHRMIWRGVQIDVSRLQGDLGQDLGRRDFTVNAMALRLPVPEPARGGFADHHGGLRDLEDRRIRHLSDRVLEEDPLRLLRAVRYATTLPGFRLDGETARAVSERAHDLSAAAAERIRQEWEAVLEDDSWHEGVASAYRLGLGPEVLGPVRDLTAVEAWGARWRRFHDDPDFPELPSATTQRLAAVLLGQEPEDVEAVSRRLEERRWPARLSATAARTAVWARRLECVEEDELVDRALREAAAAAGAAALAVAVAEHRGESPSAAADRMATFARRAGEDPWLDGHRLRDWGVPEGPALGRILDEVRRGQVRRRWGDAESARSWARGRVERETP